MDHSNSGPVMICATSVMKPGRARIGKIGGNVALPRTVPIINLVATILGGLVGLFFSLQLADGTSWVMGVGLGAGAGWLLVTYSPLKNESFLKWFELTVKSQTRSRYVDGRRVTVAVGTAVVTAPSSGRVRLERAAARVSPGQYDPRGVVRSIRNQNLDVGDTDPLLAARSRTVPHEGSTPLPSDEVASPHGQRPRPSVDRPRRGAHTHPDPVIDLDTQPVRRLPK